MGTPQLCSQLVRSAGWPGDPNAAGVSRSGSPVGNQALSLVGCALTMGASTELQYTIWT